MRICTPNERTIDIIIHEDPFKYQEKYIYGKYANVASSGDILRDCRKSPFLVFSPILLIIESDT